MDSGPSTPAKKVIRRPKAPPNHQIAYTSAFVPGTFNVKNPAGFFAAREANVEVARQVSLARNPRSPTNPSKVVVIHPGSRNLRIGRASDFYPKEVPNCIARPGERKKRAENQDVETNIGHLRDYLKNRLIQNKLATDWRDASRVTAANAKVRPEGIPEHNDPYRIDWTEETKDWFIGTEALRLPPGKFVTKWPLINRRLNRKDWPSIQPLMDDIALIIQESLQQELGISPREYKNLSVVLIVPDIGDSSYVQEMTRMLLTTMDFAEIAVHQESYAAMFSAGMSSACVVDIGATSTSITCVDEGLVAADTRISLAYGGDDITEALSTILMQSAFPYRELDLSKDQEWLMMDNLKIKICTLEEQLVANTPWDFYLLKTEGLTQKYVFRTFDENILAALCFFDTRMIPPKQVELEEDEFTTYDGPTPAMKAIGEVWTAPLDAAIAESIGTLGNENKIKTASSAILVIGGSSALKGMNAFLAERLPPLLRARGLVGDVHIVPPPRSVNPRFVSWKGASVMCNLESLNDMWIRKDEWDAIGPRALKDRYLFY